MGSAAATDLLVVGAGHAGVALVGHLARSRYEGRITMIDAQFELPYERPPLTKGYLTGAVSAEELLLRRADYWSAGSVDLRLGTEVAAIDPASHVVTFSSGETMEYRHAVWATGCEARHLPGSEATNVLSIRTLDDIRRLAELSTHGQDFVLIGGGYIGLETAATLVKLGKHVTVLEAQDRLLARVAGAKVAEFLQNEHERHGVDVRVGVSIDRIDIEAGRARAVLLADGTSVRADVIVVGIGVTPRIAPLVNAGAKVDNGVVVDASCRTSLPDVFAIGDIAAQTHALLVDAAPAGEGDSGGATGTTLTAGPMGALMRIESVPNATEHAKTLAAALIGMPLPDHAVPWFWSNQYELRLQTVGVLRGYDTEIELPREDRERLVIGYFANGRLIAADCVNAPRDFAAIRTILARGISVAPDDFADGTQSLTEISKRTTSSTAVS